MSAGCSRCVKVPLDPVKPAADLQLGRRKKKWAGFESCHSVAANRSAPKFHPEVVTCSSRIVSAGISKKRREGRETNESEDTNNEREEDEAVSQPSDVHLPMTYFRLERVATDSQSRAASAGHISQRIHSSSIKHASHLLCS